MLELVHKIDPAVPDLERRKLHEREHVFAIGGHGAGSEAARPLVRHVRRPGRDGDAGRQTLDVDGEIDARQRLIEIVNVEEDVVFGRIERAEVHQMTVAAGLNRRAGNRLMREIGRHHGRRAAKKAERVGRHELVTQRQEFGDPLRVGFRKNGDGVPIPGAMQFRMGLARVCALAALCLARIGLRDSSKLRPWRKSLKRSEIRRKLAGRTARRQSTLSLGKYSFNPGVSNRSRRASRFPRVCRSRRLKLGPVSANERHLPIPADIPLKTIDGEAAALGDFDGQTLLVVNVASQCGFTPQYAGLEALHRRFRARGFAVLGFPCDQFGHQEPGDETQIKIFCKDHYDVTFPMFAKTEVNGANAHPLFKALKHAAPGLLGTQAIKWNFTKFLVDRQRRVVRRYAPSDKPEKLAGDIAAALASGSCAASAHLSSPELRLTGAVHAEGGAEAIEKECAG